MYFLKKFYSWTSHKRPPKMQRFRGRLQEVVAYKNQTTSGPFWEEFPTHLLFGRELLLLHAISEFHVVTKSSWYALSSEVHTVN